MSVRLPYKFPQWVKITHYHLKLVMLLALTRPSRSHDLSNLGLRCMKILPDGVEFKSNSLAKQSRPSRPAAPFVFPAFTTDKNLCPKKHCLNMCLGQSPLEPQDQTGRPSSSCLISSHIVLFHPPPLLDGSWPCYL